MKREPTLFDRTLMKDAMLDFGPPRNEMLRANRFVLDRDASTFLGYLGRDCLPILAQHEFARPTHDVMWIERDSRYYHKAILNDDVPDPTADAMIGYLIANGTVYIYSASDTGHVACLPIVFRLHAPSDFDHELKMAGAFGVSRLSLNCLLLGYDDKHLPPDRREESLSLIKSIARSHRMDFSPAFAGSKLESFLDMDALYRLLRGMAGELRGILLSLLTLCRSNGARVTHTPVDRTRTIRSGRPVIYHAHNVVSINLFKGQTVQEAAEVFESGITRRRHSVRGHWAQTRKHPPCSHDWEIITKDKYVCRSCAAKRWWRKAHHRGDATKGYVTKDYDVTAKPK